MMSSAQKIRMIVSDVDGVWTDGKVAYVGERNEVKEFNVRDGLAVKLAQRAGIQVALLTSRSSPALQRRARELGITALHQGAADKLREFRRIIESGGLAAAEVLYAGDDLPDLAPMAAAGLSAAPSDAAPEVLEAAQWKLATRGGAGAFREIVERLLRERGEWDAVIREFTIGKPEAQSI